SAFATRWPPETTPASRLLRWSVSSAVVVALRSAALVVSSIVRLHTSQEQAPPRARRTVPPSGDLPFGESPGARRGCRPPGSLRASVRRRRCRGAHTPGGAARVGAPQGLQHEDGQ